MGRYSKYFMGLLAAAAAQTAVTGVHAQEATSEKTVVELFTSQGCSSCPPADALMGKLAGRTDVVGLTFPVTYWDYIGWKDTLARPQNTDRQRTYARVRGDGQIYTPQVVINGVEHVVGSDSSAIERSIRTTAASATKSGLAVTIEPDGTSIVIKITAAPGAAKSAAGEIWLASVMDKATVPIARGENGGRTVSYFNVVRDMTLIGKWNGEPLTVRLPRSQVMGSGIDHLAVLVQKDQAGPILAAAEWKPA